MDYSQLKKEGVMRRAITQADKMPPRRIFCIGKNQKSSGGHAFARDLLKIDLLFIHNDHVIVTEIHIVIEIPLTHDAV